jgi:hypothetical protein
MALLRGPGALRDRERDVERSLPTILLQIGDEFSGRSCRQLTGIRYGRDMRSSPQWIERWSFSVVPVRSLPRPADLEDPPCMVAFVRGLRRHMGLTAPDCCWYHQVDWHAANATAIRLLRLGQQAGTEGEAFENFVLDVVGAEPLGEAEREAVQSLLMTGEAIQIAEADDWGGDAPRFQNGRHRVTAMRDTRVPETVVARLDLLDPATGQVLMPEWEQ